MRLFFAGLLVLPLFASDTQAPLPKYTAMERRHWAFQPRADVQPPPGAANPIDAFVRARLTKDGLKPSPKADRATLARRIYLDLTGLLPSPAEVDAFVNDRSPDAWPKLIDRLLASPRYGERWGQHWLDVVRFAESDGFEYDTHRFDAWRYRDYVIRAFNNDKPYDRFLIEQLAGDEIAPKEDETRIAAGFNRLAPLRKNAGNQDVASSRNEVLTEQTNIVGSAFLGVTLGCARCHDHKFDPIRQSDYYRIQAYFADAAPDDIDKATDEQKAAWKSAAAPIEKQMGDVKTLMKKAEGPERLELQQKLDNLEATLPSPLPKLFSVKDDPDHRAQIHLLARGDWQNKGDRVAPRPLGILLPDGTPELPETTPNPRADLAKWIADPANPLTARVMVNRIWHYHFGRGIVATPNDFGRMGERPTHPELLDYLANEFVKSGFSVKHIHRLILTSETYQQASDAPNTAAREKDPDNRLLWRYNRQRLEAEEIRDNILNVAGKLNLKDGGPSVIVPIDPELTGALYKPSQWAVNKDVSEHLRRTVYLIQKRNLRLPMLEVFDQPDTQGSCPRRESSTHAPQALELLNGTFSNQQAEAFAARLKAEAGAEPEKQVDLAFRLATGRLPNAQEKRAALAYLKTGPLREFALAVFNLNAFLYVN